MKPEDYTGKYIVRRLRQINRVERAGIAKYCDWKAGTESIEGEGVALRTNGKTLYRPNMFLCITGKNTFANVEVFDSKEELLNAYPDDPTVLAFITDTPDERFDW